MIERISSSPGADRAVIVFSPDAHILHANQAFAQLTGYSLEELIGQKTCVFQSARNDRSFCERLWRKLRKTGCWQGEIWNRRRNGTLYLLRLEISAQTDGTGQLISYIGFTVDITAGRQRQLP